MGKWCTCRFPQATSWTSGLLACLEKEVLRSPLVGGGCPLVPFTICMDSHEPLHPHPIQIVFPLCLSDFQMETFSTVFETVWLSLWPIVRKHILLCDPGLTDNVLGTEVSEVLRCDVISFFLEGNAGPKHYWLHASGHAIPDLEASGPHVIWIIEQGPEMGARQVYMLASRCFLSEWRASLALGWFAGC